MNFLYENIQGGVAKIGKNFIAEITLKYDLPEEEVTKLWEEVLSRTEEPIKKKKKKKLKLKKEKSGKKKTMKTDKEAEIKLDIAEVNKCPYIVKRGSRIGETCGCKIKKGSIYCTIHERKMKKLSETPITITRSPAAAAIVIRRHQVHSKFFCHADSSLLFRSKSEGAVAKLVDQKIVPLENKDIEKCKAFGFYFDSDIFDELDV